MQLKNNKPKKILNFIYRMIYTRWYINLKMRDQCILVNRSVSFFYYFLFDHYIVYRFGIKEKSLKFQRIIRISIFFWPTNNVLDLEYMYTEFEEIYSQWIIFRFFFFDLYVGGYISAALPRPLKNQQVY